MVLLIIYLIGVVVTFFISRYLLKQSNHGEILTRADFNICMWFTFLSWGGLFCIGMGEMFHWLLEKEWTNSSNKDKLPPKWFR